MSKSLTLRSGRRVVLNDADEESSIQAGIDADPETREPSEDKTKALRRVGRPPLPVTKERITIRLSPDVVEAFRATGKGWQTRMDSALKDWLKDHSATSNSR
ncbi:BrnA antitoxin family protein [Thioalkalivibrio sp. ALJ9]|uniref:BrnA antitoxin family protein n=1 Tax=Thioalkalivibrio sp. ALJ9 TaxID=1158758 RepID=UPI0003A9483B|nr:BrnA antitoxin family protein [Thioalkalivibrio sp. ALJ9]